MCILFFVYGYTVIFGKGDKTNRILIHFKIFLERIN